jgi:hypothetical protein
MGRRCIVCFVTTIGLRWQKKWKQTVEAVVTTVVLSVVGVVGLAMLGSEALAVGRMPGEVKQALASEGAIEELWSFDVPVVWASRFQTQTAEAQASIQRAENAVLNVQNWKYTQNPTADALALSLNLYVRALQAEIALATFNNIVEQIQNRLAANPSPFAQFLNNVLESIQGQVNNTVVNYVNMLSVLQSAINPFIPANIRLPPIPVVSPCTC